MPEPYRTTRRVEFRDTDAAGIMHFSTFFTYMEEVEHELLRRLGLSVVMHDSEGPISWPRVSASCEYRSAVKFEDVLDISVQITRRGEKSVTYAFAFTSGIRPIASGQIVAVCCRVTAGGQLASIPVPAWISERLSKAGETNEGS